MQFGYGLNYLIDIANAIIVDVEPTPARTYDEVESTKTMLDRTERRFGLKPRRLTADTAYGTGRFLGWLVGHRIAPHIPVRDASERDDGTLSRSDFRWDRRRGVYICPNGKVLHTTGKVHEGKTLRYLASKFDCDVCALKMQCCPNSPSRQVPRDVHEYARDVTRRLMRTKAFLKSRDQRKRVEMRFAHLKIHHGFERMRLRGLSGARDEFLLAATVQNLKTWRFEPSGHHPPGGMHRLPDIAHDHVSASASKPPPIKRQQNLTAGQSELDQNYSNSITPTEEPAFSIPSALIGNRLWVAAFQTMLIWWGRGAFWSTGIRHRRLRIYKIRRKRFKASCRILRFRRA